MPEMLDRPIRKAVWHLPKLGGADVRLTAHEASARFCSFGSNWTNKIAVAALETESCACNGYVDLDVTHILTDSKTGFIKRSEGWVVRTKVKGSGFAAVATGDSYYTPQILELNFQISSGCKCIAFFNAEAACARKKLYVFISAIRTIRKFW